MISVEPKIGETSGSAVLNLLGAFAAGYTGTAYYGSHIYEYKSDLQDLELMDGDSSVPTVLRGMGVVPISISAGSVNMDDIAQRGVFAFLPDVFFDCENLHLKIWDLKRPGEIIQVPIPRACVEQICVDFEPYMDMLRAKEAELLLPR